MRGSQKETTCLKFQFGNELNTCLNWITSPIPENFCGCSCAWHELMCFTELEP